MHTFAIALALLVAAGPSIALAAPAPKYSASGAFLPGGPRVRPYDGRTATLLLEGIQRSGTFREIVNRIEMRDVIVYLQMQPQLKGRLAGSMTWLTRTNHFRYVRISISPDINGELAIATLGHELQHALEVASAPSVIDPESLTAHYRQIGITVKGQYNGWDTEAAQIAGDEIRRDLAASRAARAPDAVPRFEPLEWDTIYRDARDRVR
jgi:hypothetical protein